MAMGGIIPKSFKMELTQIHKSLLKKKNKKTNVFLDYQYPSRFILNSENETMYTNNGKKSWFYKAPFIEGEEGEVVIQKNSQLGLLRFFDSLQRGFEKSKYFSYKLTDKKLSFIFNKKGIEVLNLKQMDFYIKKPKKISMLKIDDVLEMVMVKSNGQKTRLLIKSVKKDIPFKYSHFNFKIPPHTKIIKR